MNDRQARATDLTIAILKQQIRNLEETIINLQVENIILKEEKDAILNSQLNQ